MKLTDSGRYNVVYRIPARGLIGFRTEYLNATRGMGIVNSLFDGWDEYAVILFSVKMALLLQTVLDRRLHTQSSTFNNVERCS